MTALKNVSPAHLERLLQLEDRLLVGILEAEEKAWDSLARYKFFMFGYWAAVWVGLSRIHGAGRPNPWASLVKTARSLGHGQRALSQREAA